MNGRRDIHAAKLSQYEARQLIGPNMKAVLVAAGLVAACLLKAIIGTDSAHAEPARVPNQITLAIGADAGGGYDAYGRLVARHMGRFLPGNPSIIPSNMPGAAGLR